jgi:hypothetical protein
MATADDQAREQERLEGRDTASASPTPPQTGNDAAAQWADTRDGGETTAEETHEREAPASHPTRRPPVFARDATGDDVGLDVAQLKVDELSVELQATIGVERLNVGAKGLEGELYLRANLGNVVALVDSAGQRTPGIVESVARTRGWGRHGGGPGAGAGLQGELQAAVESARSAYERVAAPELRRELEDAYDTVRTAYQHVLGGEESQDAAPVGDDTDGDSISERHDSGLASAGERAKQLASSPAGAATAAVAVAGAGAAAGALASSKARRSRIADKLPGRHRRGMVEHVAERAAGAPGDVARAVRRRLH